MKSPFASAQIPEVVSKAIDALVKSTRTNRSHVVREILYGNIKLPAEVIKEACGE